jgi:hypothetical protein
MGDLELQHIQSLQRAAAAASGLQGVTSTLSVFLSRNNKKIRRYAVYVELSIVMPSMVLQMLSPSVFRSYALPVIVLAGIVAYVRFLISALYRCVQDVRLDSSSVKRRLEHISCCLALFVYVGNIVMLPAFTPIFSKEPVHAGIVVVGLTLAVTICCIQSITVLVSHTQMGAELDMELAARHIKLDAMTLRKCKFDSVHASDAATMPTLLDRKAWDCKQLKGRIALRTKSVADCCEQVSCIICLSAFQGGETIRQLRCMHFFHLACIDEWLLKGSPAMECPLRCARPVAAPEKAAPPLTANLASPRLGTGAQADASAEMHIEVNVSVDGPEVLL